MRVILASASPARLATLRHAGLQAQAIVSEVDESRFEAPTVEELAALLAKEKAEAVFSTLVHPSDVIIIGCDSILDFEGKPQGKPGSPEQAARLLRRTRGRSGVLITGHHVIVCAQRTQRLTRVGKTTVHVGDITDEEIADYVATGEPEGVAGGFTIDGLGGAFITGLEGDHHNVVGLSLPLLRHMLADCGIRWTSLWTS